MLKSHLTSHSNERGKGRARVRTECPCVSFFFSAVVRGCGARIAFLLRPSLLPPRVHHCCLGVPPFLLLAFGQSAVALFFLRHWRAACTRAELHRCTGHERHAKPTRWPKKGPKRRTQRRQLTKLRERPLGDRSGAHGTGASWGQRNGPRRDWRSAHMVTENAHDETAHMATN